MLKIRATVVECNQRKFEDKVYYQLMVNNTDKDFEIPLGLVSSVKPYTVGSDVFLTLVRDKEFKLRCRVAND